MPLAAGHGAMPLGGHGGVILPRQGDGAMLLGEDGGVMLPQEVGAWRDAVIR
jgi:hypothetical protein